MRCAMWGWTNPKIGLIEWIQSTYPVVIYANTKKTEINIINMPLFKCTFTMEDTLNAFVGSVHYVDTPITGYQNCDEMIGEWETIHKLYSEYDDNDVGVVWAHPEQTYQTTAQKINQQAGKKVNKETLWKKNPLIERRINAVWNPKYLQACWNIQFLKELCPAQTGIFFIYFL